jgi:hypothetical protein
VQESKIAAVQTVCSRKHSAWTQNPSGFGQELVLKAWRWHVMEHREADDRVKTRITKGQRRRILTQDYNLLPQDPLAKRSSKSGVDFDARESSSQRFDQLGGQPEAWTDFQHVAAECHVLESPRHTLLNNLPPVPRLAQPMV